MKTTLTTFTLLFALTISVSGQKTEEKLVKEAFDNYKSSILNDKGEEAVKHVDTRTVKYYNDISNLVRNADSAKVEGLSILDKLMVFSIRHRASREEILSFDGRTLLIYAIKSGMVGKNGVANLSIGNVAITDQFAKGQLVVNGKPAPLYFHFYQEEGKWKIDLTSIFQVSTAAFKKMVDDSGQNENEYIFSLLDMLTGKKPGSEIWLKVQ